MNTLFEDTVKGAIISACQKYRYSLWRIWDNTKPNVLFIMLNPSTADADIDDPTIRRCIGFAKSWGYGGVYVGNLFAYRSTNPKELLKAINPIGDDNIFHLQAMSSRCEIAVCAWGNSAIVTKLCKNKPLSVIQIALNYLELSNDGTPKHPLYLRSDLKPVEYLIN